jgi:hypothetical protein
MAIVRGNHVTGVKRCDSRVILGKEEVPNGGSDITLTTKPDTPLKRSAAFWHTVGRAPVVEYDDGIDGPPVSGWDIPGLMSRSLGDVAHSAGVIGNLNTE